MNDKIKVLVTGATGYIGGRLVPRLVEKGYFVRCMARDASRISDRWQGAETIAGDVLQPESLQAVLEDIDIAYYLIHSMSAGEDSFGELDIQAARNFSTAAKNCGVKRIIYLGGLGAEKNELSPHLASRQKTGEILKEAGVPVTEFRAGMIVGSGSLSFEMVRYLTERVPIMITPKWVRTKTQPIAVRNVLQYLIGSIEKPETADKTFEIGGTDVLSYGDLMTQYGQIRGLKRIMIHVPLLTPRLSSYWVDFVTPIPSSIARPLIEGLKTELICNDDAVRNYFDFELFDYQTAVKLALERERKNEIETIWSGAISSINPKNINSLDLSVKEGMIIEKREIVINSNPKNVFETVSKVGGKHGWYANFLWQMRGLLDRFVGGVGMRRGRRDPDNLLVGDPLDFWRVEAIEQNRLIRLRAEMKLPGRAWLQFNISEIGDGKSKLTQTAFYEPKGLFGLLYWYSIYFLHGYIFGGMIKSFKEKAELLSA
ncbi:MAG: SDR family oxidoreductase [Melioribacteraceae bacterium]|nr:SDR family oxidoreductase [Melioribacteraceae bacterium]MCF8264139.1 SDR family oxidoreductase [Melioribacteraceae bacterium]MCF8413796.1 SDR family oxidoreductase [Melioribacteraceae bacterium]MCF8430763.1 SDR family oxidoreductase [Melioribacteraceae bacterium]